MVKTKITPKVPGKVAGAKPSKTNHLSRKSAAKVAGKEPAPFGLEWMRDGIDLMRYKVDLEKMSIQIERAHV